jgi:hypothetical protein
MNAQLTVDECKVMWVVGALERLATLGLLSPDIPTRLTADAIDIFIEIDRDVDLLFSSDYEIASIFREIASTFNEREVDENDMRSIVNLILEFKNNRTEMVKYALSHQII